MRDSNIQNQNVKPFLKWVGGKRWFISNHADLIPEKFNRYIEPFLGSGAIFFHLKPRKAILGDINPDLIDTFLGVKKDWKNVIRNLQKHEKNHSKEYYYKIRKAMPRSLASKAARLIYLNRTCWNGLYRVNNQGFFNVPIGSRSKIIRDDDDFQSISELLKKVKLYRSDFERLIDKAEVGDLVFVDPPYTVCHNNNAFVKYNENFFSWNDQERLCEALIRAKRRGAFILSTNAYHKSVIQLYKGNFKTKQVVRFSTIASKISARSSYEELVIRS